MAASGSSNNGSDAPLCANNCGFYGNPKNQNLCSVCYAAFLKESGEDSTSNDVVQSQIGTGLVGVRDDEEENLRTGGSPPALESSETSADSTSNDVVQSQIGTGLVGVRDDEEENLRTGGSPPALESSETSESVADLKKSAPKTKNRCRMCKKKVGLLGFNCRCGDLFCGRHRYPETHSCDADHKAIGREILKKQIIECKADKLEFRV